MDASQKTIGMALMQSIQDKHESEALFQEIDSTVVITIKISIPSDLMPVACGCWTLTDAETCYANVERELPGVVARIEKFHTFCYGRSMIVLSDYKPFVTIVQKDLVNAPTRLQQLLLRLQKYSVTINLERT